MALACELSGGLLRKCGRPASGVCRWCGRPFCSQHRSAVASKQPVCSAHPCTAKEAFAATASQAKQRAQAHNREGLCGLPTCGNRLPGATCRICGAEYCPSHLSARLFRVVDSPKTGNVETKKAQVKSRLFICDQCIDLFERYGTVELPVELDV